MTVHMYNNLDGGDIFYTLKGDVPNRNANVYEKPFLINESVVIKAVVSNTDTISSQVGTLSFHKMPFRVAINYQIPYSKTYTAGGKNGYLIPFAVQKIHGVHGKAGKESILMPSLISEVKGI